MPSWPFASSKIDRGSWQQTFPDTVIRSEVDQGPGQTRRLSSAKPVPVSFTMRLDQTELNSLYDFFHTTLADGALQFDMDHPFEGVTYSWRFTGPPQYQHRHTDKHNVSIKLERLA